jgi:hypothetical protein
VVRDARHGGHVQPRGSGTRSSRGRVDVPPRVGGCRIKPRPRGRGHWPRLVGHARVHGPEVLGGGGRGRGGRVYLADEEAVGHRRLLVCLVVVVLLVAGPPSCRASGRGHVAGGLEVVVGGALVTVAAGGRGRRGAAGEY